MWPLADFTAENGPTRLIPGSHLYGQIPSAALDDPIAPHPDEITLTAPVGTVVIFNAHVWHGATTNPQCIPRPNYTSFGGRRQFYDGTRTENRLSPAARCLFDPPEST